ncbi:MAG: L-serine ammonia-lyase, iron-sulfur-dependent, subunit alpha [Bacilli bacterium]|nr:L-serine ammonia-lyase, iron-sulfur-dependent, subunit alpha [Bacilli bacterium]
MRSIKEIFVIGHGPSSSHTMGPAFACDYILNKYSDIDSIKVTLFGSLAKTGKGHLTDYIIQIKLKDLLKEIIFDANKNCQHPNTLLFEVKTKDGKEHQETILSVGGGTIVVDDKVIGETEDVYPLSKLTDIVNYCKQENISLVDYVKKYEKSDIIAYLSKAYDAMELARSNGIEAKGELPGNLHVQRKARQMYLNMRENRKNRSDILMNVAISSFAVAEENAAGGIIVLAPTCGSAGVIPGVITYLKMFNYSRKDIINGLCVAGLIGIIAKTNASVSGAECGCQAEIGVACAMSAALIASTLGYDIDKIAQSAEIAMEHSLGLTCDPVDGYVQIPCIERCAIFALKAINAATLAKIIPTQDTKVSFDQSIQTMYQTGLDLQEGYKETAGKGLAKVIKNC